LDPYEEIMKRRTFFAAVGASAAVALWPRLIRRAFADASFDAPGAKSAQRPRLVIVVPADDAQKYRRGEVWGEYLNHGEPAQLAPLGNVDVSCATMRELGALAQNVEGEPLALLFERDGSVRALDAKLPDDNVGRFDPKADDAIVDKRIAIVAAMIARALPPVPAGDVRAAAARVIRAVRAQPPTGSHWANASGCGPATVENLQDDSDEIVGYGCGMGHVPAKSSRFLYFFAKTPQQLEREWMAAQAKKDNKAQR
jgi:hypothetical protein